MLQFNDDNFQSFCNELAERDPIFKNILQQHSYPPMWTRPASFATLIHIVLEQQVSLASARAAFNKLKEKIGQITPARLLQLTDEELRACYFSRQKTVYARHLAEAFISKKIQLNKLTTSHDDVVRGTLTQVKGIGDWTADVYLLFALQRTDIFPIGDLAMVNALKEVKQLPAKTPREDILLLAEPWRPYRGIAAYLLWHHYIKSKNIKL
ncbi:3-methyladenine DNA glycosylase [Niastella yeongjuensis]|uniref:DNA-3-methyladenine glycosylase II n=1 Tax=Niastella yeongjuensis TaxID=354355 RepID=A0A1V9ET79_9BACT|nr:DNA-3-methyladenine glycosylase [Niastella yeongjuensis]OQP49356.1 3-methyladenine DNA glycosylase [Niastella yeongjuensis]SEP43542.1 DNA-3-methyladenine glycosylase II [Niastella yeongjuensis]